MHELSALESFRVRILPVLGPLPCMFGQAAAAYVLAMMAGNIKMQPLSIKYVPLMNGSLYKANTFWIGTVTRFITK